MMHHVQEMEHKVVMVVQVVLIHHQMETHLAEAGGDGKAYGTDGNWGNHDY